MPANAPPAGTRPVMHRFGPSLVRLFGAALVLLLLTRQVGAGPFQDGLHAVTWPAILAAFALTAVTTVCSAWRWRVVARALGIDLALPAAVGAYYRSQFLNSVLPGGVLGDVHRAVAHGRHAGDLARGMRAVAWERFFGQVIQAVVTAAVLLVLPSPIHPGWTYLMVGVAGGAGCVGLAIGFVAWRAHSRPTRVTRAVVDDLRGGLLARDVWPRLTLASVLVIAGHTTTFVIAARVAGSTAPLGELVALLMLVQTAMVIPLSVGGWGPREGAAAGAFAAAGLGAAAGVTVTTLYAVIALVAVTPGAALLLGDFIGRARRRRRTPAAGTPAAGSTALAATRSAGKELEGIRG